MGILEDWKEEFNLSIIILAAVIFYTIAVDRFLGQVYIGLWFMVFVIEYALKNKYRIFDTFPGQTNWGKALFFTLISFAFFLVLASFITGISSLAGLFDFLRQETAPVLAKDTTLNFIGTAFIGPVIETRAMWRINEALLYNFNKMPVFDLRNVGIWISILLTGTFFSLLHIAVKLGSEASLFITIVFWVVSAWLILYTQKMLEGKLLHIFNNSLVRLFQLGVLRF